MNNIGLNHNDLNKNKKYYNFSGKVSLSEESSDSHVLVYKLLTALGFTGMKDALYIVF